MNTFNSNFYQPNTKHTVESATQRLISLGYNDFTFKSVSYTNGCSFYFTTNDNKEIRVSDHPLTGKRAFETIQIAIEDIKTFSNPMKVRNAYLNNEITKSEYKNICDQKGFIYKP